MQVVAIKWWKLGRDGGNPFCRVADRFEQPPSGRLTWPPAGIFVLHSLAARVAQW